MNLVRQLLATSPVVLAPMESITDAAFRRICRGLGASLCMTEFIAADQMIADSLIARRRAYLPDDERPTAIQIYGVDPDLLVTAARIAEAARPSFIDINCGCWIPAIARRDAGAGWLRDPSAMVAMARRIVETVALPVTVKTRIGWGPESEMPITELDCRLEDAVIAARSPSTAAPPRWVTAAPPTGAGPAGRRSASGGESAPVRRRPCR